LSLNRFIRATLAFLFFALVASSLPRASAATEGMGALHWSGDKTLYDTRANRMDLIGHAAIHQGGESLFADKIIFERDSKLVHAIGNAVYVGKTALIQGSEMHFNLETRTGTIIAGRVSTEQFTLSGERINKLGAGRFQAHRADYSTCKDCPQSWTLSSADVDLEIDGYAYLSNVTAKVMDAPAFWIPYLIVPIKTSRQTGLLMPQFSFANEGFRFVQPFFWAISRSFDMTFGLGNYGGRGRRLEVEGRYALSKGGGQANFYHLDDRRFRDYLAGNNFTANKDGYSSSRWAAQAEQAQELPFGIIEKLRVVDVSDAAYLTQVGLDVPGNGEAYLYSDLSLSHSTDKVSSYIFARRYRNILTPIGADPRTFDPSTVQVFPQAEVTSNDKVFGDGKLVAGISLGATNFVRGAKFFDRDRLDTTTSIPADGGYRPGIDPIRTAIRTKINPSAYTNIRIADAVSVTPHANYRHYFYDFKTNAPTLSRGYLHLDTDISMSFERIYDRDPDSEITKVKHIIRPIINYSVIPFRSTPSHPFTNQMEYARTAGFTGYNFDNDDIVPMDSTLSNANYFAPQGNALSYGFVTQLRRKRKTGGEGSLRTYTYDQPIEWSAGQSFNFRELRKSPDERFPLSRFYSLMTATFDRTSAYADYYYIPYQPQGSETSRHVVSLGGKWASERGSGRVLAYERSIALNYVYNRSSNQSQNESVRLNAIYSLNDYIMPGVGIAYNVIGSRLQEANTTLTFQSPSECWKMDLGYYQNVCPIDNPGDSGWCHRFQFNLSLNLTGSGFGSVSDPKALASTAGAQ
jgi:LPS-assembly protein